MKAYENEAEITFEFEILDLFPEEIEVSIDEDLRELVVSGEREIISEAEDEEGYVAKEDSQNIEEMVRIPEDVDIKTMRKEFLDGKLRVVFDKEYNL